MADRPGQNGKAAMRHLCLEGTGDHQVEFRTEGSEQVGKDLLLKRGRPSGQPSDRLC